MKKRKIKKGSQKALQQLAREEMKHKLLTDIVIDMTICKVQGWDIYEHIKDVRQMLDEIIKKHKM